MLCLRNEYQSQVKFKNNIIYDIRIIQTIKECFMTGSVLNNKKIIMSLLGNKNKQTRTMTNAALLTRYDT